MGIPEDPFQPHDHNFTKHEFGQTGKVYRSFQSSWFGRWKWMHYDATNDLSFCHLCMVGAKSGKLSSSSESAFIFIGFSNWDV